MGEGAPLESQRCGIAPRLAEKGSEGGPLAVEVATGGMQCNVNQPPFPEPSRAFLAQLRGMHDLECPGSPI